MNTIQRSCKWNAVRNKGSDTAKTTLKSSQEN